MKAGAFFLLIIIIGCSSDIEKNIEPQNILENPEVESMKLKSNSFREGDMIPREFTCQGENVNPQLSWGSVPREAKSLALIVDDPDAPVGLFTHWLVKDIQTSTHEIGRDSIPGVEVANDFGQEGYGGPCPPSGVHRYFFKLYALDVETLDADDKESFYSEVEKHMIAQTELIGKYKKS